MCAECARSSTRRRACACTQTNGECTANAHMWCQQDGTAMRCIYVAWNRRRILLAGKSQARVCLCVLSSSRINQLGPGRQCLHLCSTCAGDAHFHLDFAILSSAATGKSTGRCACVCTVCTYRRQRTLAAVSATTLATTTRADPAQQPRAGRDTQHTTRPSCYTNAQHNKRNDGATACVGVRERFVLVSFWCTICQNMGTLTNRVAPSPDPSRRRRRCRRPFTAATSAAANTIKPYTQALRQANTHTRTHTRRQRPFVNAAKWLLIRRLAGGLACISTTLS